MDVKRLLFLSSLGALLVFSCANASSSDAAEPPRGKSRGAAIFGTYCTLCHGTDGTLGVSGAKNLAISSLSKEEMIAVVNYGRGAMTPYKSVLSKAEIDAVVEHVRTLKTVE